MPPPERTKREIVEALAADGVSATEIANQTGIKYGTVYYYLNNRPGDKSESKAIESGKNTDRNQCKTCQYRGKSNGCDYITLVGHSRGCSVADCTVYIKGSPALKGKLPRTD